MNEVIKIKKVPEPVPYRNGERFIGGWNTAAVAKWLINKKFEKQFTGLSAVASSAYGRDSAANRESVKRNIASLRRYMASKDEFLLVRYGDRRRVEAVKVCDSSEIEDRQVAEEQLITLEARGDVTFAEAKRWRTMLYLPASSSTSGGSEDASPNP